MLLTTIFLFVSLVSAVCKDNSPPTAPGSLTITDTPYDSDGSITLNWKAAGDSPDCGEIDYYNIYRQKGSGSFVKIGSTSGTSYNNGGLSTGFTYFYRVTAVDSVVDNPHEGPSSNTVSTTIGTAPAQNNVRRGGGGGGGRSGDCVPSWECSEWSECKSGGVQTRACVDKWACDDENDKPEEEQACEYVEEGSSSGNTFTVSGSGNDDGSGDETEELRDSGKADERLNELFNDITGAAVGGIGASIWWLIILLIALAIIIGGYFIVRSRNKY